MMRIYTLHIGPHPGPGAERGMALVKEGFCWPAVFFPVIWALWHRLWLTAAGIALALGALDAAAQAAGLMPAARAVASLAALVLIGLFANDWRRMELARRGFRETGVVAAPSLAAAELRALESMGAKAA